MNEFQLALAYYKEAAERGCVIGFRTQSIINCIFGLKEDADKLEQKYKEAPYDNKRVSFNLSRDYKKNGEYEERIEEIKEGEDCLLPLPLSLLALNEQEVYKYIDKIFGKR